MNKAALEKVKADKIREVRDGHDGTWVAHPGLVPVAMEVFNEHMPSRNQLSIKREDFNTSAKELLEVPTGTITAEGICSNIHIGILYLESWLRGQGAAAINNLMEDAATAEISRTQVWQWLHNGVKLSDGRVFNYELYTDLLHDEIINIRETVGCDQYQKGQFVQAVCLFNKLVVQPEFEEFLTLSAYDIILSNNQQQVCVEQAKEVHSSQFIPVQEAV